MEPASEERNDEIIVVSGNQNFKRLLENFKTLLDPFSGKGYVYMVFCKQM